MIELTEEEIKIAPRCLRPLVRSNTSIRACVTNAFKEASKPMRAREVRILVWRMCDKPADWTDSKFKTITSTIHQLARKDILKRVGVGLYEYNRG